MGTNQVHAPGTVEDEEPHARAEGGRKEFVLESGKMRVEAWAYRELHQNGSTERHT